MSTKALMTVEQFAQMHTADTEDYELVEGELIPLPSGTVRHAQVRGLTEYKFRAYFERNPIGHVFAELDCRVADDTTRRPDVSVFLGGRIEQIDMNSIPVPFAPDIAVEVLSPSESALDVRRKVREYLRAGCKEVWLMDHSNGEIEIHSSGSIRLLQETDPLESQLLPGFTAAVSDLVGKTLAR